ncbi:hypothetical protein EKO27_g5183 [Xylaria grammica]|uniref:Uncharacterized protein n=1 Tax=Xylaria grammica TaxID=363999 RepID=A0A439D6A9_9PEZI|nr:hypothetical protein EKO27_g5183 [Xylaria grammica]
MLLDKKTDYLLREGKLAGAPLDNITDISKRMDGLTDDARAYLRRKNAALFAMSSHLLQRGPRAGRGQLAAKHRVENAAASGPRNAARSPVEEPEELLGKRDGYAREGRLRPQGARSGGPSLNLDIFPADLGLLVAEAVLAAAQYAWAHQPSAAEEITSDGPVVAPDSAAHEEATLLRQRGDNGLAVDRDEAIPGTMDKGLAPSVELAAALGLPALRQGRRRGPGDEARAHAPKA